MAINETREIVIEASPEEILDVIGDLDSVTEWSPPHQSAEILEKDKDGRPLTVKMKVKAAGITDEQVVAYTWSENKVSWTLVSSGQQRSQDASYTLTPDGDKTKVALRDQRRPRGAVARFRAQARCQGNDRHRHQGAAGPGARSEEGPGLDPRGPWTGYA